MLRWADGVDDVVTSAVSRGLDDLARLEMVERYEHGPDLGLADGNWDYVIVGDFADADAYLAYAGDEAHQRLIRELIRPNIVDRAAVQYRL
jgi:hypothetical protein